MYRAYSAAEDMASTMAVKAMGLAIGVIVGVPIRGIIHRPVHVHLWPHTIVCPR
jgi:hypothetical protein